MRIPATTTGLPPLGCASADFTVRSSMVFPSEARSASVCST